MAKEKERLLPVTGVYNMRDLGGYKTKDNKQTKWGTIIRSADLALLTDADLEYLSKLPLKTIIDFRGSQEKESNPDKKPASIVSETWLPIEAGDLAGVQIEDPDNIPQIMKDIYKGILHNFQNELKKFFRILENDLSAPLLFHCSAGKDRTGIAAALFLSALGVDRNIIMEDYMLSAEYIKGKYDFIIQLYPSLAPLTTVQSGYLESAFEELDENFGGVDDYLKDLLQVDIPKLKKLYTE